MALGRHRAELPAHEVDGFGLSDVVLWGGFVTVSTGVSMALFGLNVLTIAFVTAALAGGFLLVSWLGALTTVPFTTPASFETPVWSETRREHAPPAASPAAGTHPPAIAQKTPVAIEPGSRWIEAFGPPETGQLPIQRYLQDNGAVTPQATVDADSTLSQWSHSRA